jgi:hypothetical protein
MTPQPRLARSRQSGPGVHRRPKAVQSIQPSSCRQLQLEHGAQSRHVAPMSSLSTGHSATCETTTAPALLPENASRPPTRKTARHRLETWEGMNDSFRCHFLLPRHRSYCIGILTPTLEPPCDQLFRPALGRVFMQLLSSTVFNNPPLLRPNIPTSSQCDHTLKHAPPKTSHLTRKSSPQITTLRMMYTVHTYPPRTDSVI